MKRFSDSDSVGVLTSICPSKDEKNPKTNNGYSREFQAMLDSLDEEDCMEETSLVTEKKRRLSLDQVKVLEKHFELENKLEPALKTKLAEELGLQPRQVAIWFQNRRARWKTKQLEKDYDLLKAKYDAIRLECDNLEKENETLNAQVRELKGKLTKEHEKSIQSVKEEALFSDSENNVSEQSKISPGGLSGESESTNLNYDLFNITNKMGFKGFGVDGSSDSDSSGIFKGESNLNHQLLVSQAAPCSSLSLMNWFQFSDMRAMAAKAYQHQFGRVEDQSFFGTEESCNFFSVDQSPSLHWYNHDRSKE